MNVNHTRKRVTFQGSHTALFTSALKMWNSYREGCSWILIGGILCCTAGQFTLKEQPWIIFLAVFGILFPGVGLHLISVSKRERKILGNQSKSSVIARKALGMWSRYTYGLLLVFVSSLAAYLAFSDLSNPDFLSIFAIIIAAVVFVLGFSYIRNTACVWIWILSEKQKIDPEDDTWSFWHQSDKPSLQASLEVLLPATLGIIAGKWLISFF